jgi:hypothetical protein
MLMRKTETNNYCGAEPMISSFAPATSSAGGWYKVTVPLSAFDCEKGGGLQLDQIDQFDWQNTNIRNAVVCIGDATIDR